MESFFTLTSDQSRVSPGLKLLGLFARISPILREPKKAVVQVDQTTALFTGVQSAFAIS